MSDQLGMTRQQWSARWAGGFGDANYDEVDAEEDGDDVEGEVDETQ